MMNWNDLDIELKKLSEKEMSLKTGLSSLNTQKRGYHFDSDGEKIYDVNYSNNLPNEIFLFKNNRFTSIPTHTHSHIEINYMYSGSCTQTINNQVKTLKKGQLVFIDTKTPHSIGYTETEDIMLNFIIKKEFLNNRFLSKISNNNLLTNFFINALSNSSSKNNYIWFNSENETRLHDFIHFFILECYHPSKNHRELKNSIFEIIILELINSIQSTVDEKSISKSNSLVMAALNYIDANFLTCTLEETAQALHVNASYLTTVLKKTLNYSYKELIIQSRLDYAKDLIIHSNLTINEIAIRSGYSNQTFFYNKFKEKFNLTPKQFRIYAESNKNFVLQN